MDSSDNRIGFWEQYGKPVSFLIGLAICIASYCLAYYDVISSEQAWASTIEIVLAIIAGFGYEKASSLKRCREAAVIISEQKSEINTQEVKIKELNTKVQEISQRGGNGATMLQASSDKKTNRRNNLHHRDKSQHLARITITFAHNLSFL